MSLSLKTINLCLYGFTYSVLFLKMSSYNIHLEFFHVAYWFRDIYTLLCIWELHSFLWLNCIPLYVQSSIHLSVYCYQLVCWYIVTGYRHYAVMMDIHRFSDYKEVTLLTWQGIFSQNHILSTRWTWHIFQALQDKAVKTVAYDKYLDCFLTKLDMLAVFSKG